MSTQPVVTVRNGARIAVNMIVPQRVTVGGGKQGPPGPQGEPGPEGPPGGFILRGEVETWDDLPTSGQAQNDAYVVADTGRLAMWDGTEWIDVGSIVGPEGPVGPPGEASRWSAGEGPPETLGEFDFYLDIDSGDIWGGVSTYAAMVPGAAKITKIVATHMMVPGG